MILKLACLSALVCASPVREVAHSDNPVYQALLNGKVNLAGTPVRFEPPLLREVVH